MCSDDGVSLARLTSRPFPAGGGQPSFRSTYVSTPTDEHDQGVWLTQEAHDRLKAELDELVAGRPAMSAEINARREEGDLRENGGDHPPQEEEGEQGGRLPPPPHPPPQGKGGGAPQKGGQAATGAPPPRQ